MNDEVAFREYNPKTGEGKEYGPNGTTYTYGGQAVTRQREKGRKEEKEEER